MINIKLYKTDFDLLKSVVDPDVFDRLSYKKGDYDVINLEVTAYIVDILQDQLISKLMEAGLKDDFETNPLGNQLESLIDKISSSIPD
ncbi:hypothetical protein KXD93_19880 [Mucilaginibacter sp. BJC16-A38]|uniref:hypothetical protein n=1 Tax=Mucilaginibacter phenanthrenivorans TaxID=1234842 RepID=UPI0021585500|nr:hypothetical protein [Mucilaginibacter phenanthrenivorans]MCR8559921.1 hypothetical protein [Mucilaginibacter phenanthrenivorans]